MQFNRLRLSGFKSFVDPTELVIQSGLTGIVGPNGCGKSNLLEALRWVMGESSARLVRGAEMDDVIFAGTASRPARNLAEVALVLDNSARRAPAAFNQTAELEISRRIERESGSAYRINGKEVRARDVQLLFADASVGARSPALVGQGKIGAIINAKPKDRRAILEEAAGIGGLHSRRHEAELRLRAAETNLVRVDDAVGALAGQLNALKRQARQASRYRNVQAQLRKGEAVVLHLKWLEAEAALAAARAELAAAEAAVAAAAAAASHAISHETSAAEAIAPLRETEQAAAQTLHRLLVERDGLALEERRTGEALARLAQVVGEITRDRQREETLLGDARAALGRLEAERADLDRAEQGSGAAAALADTELSEAQARLTAREAALDAANRELAAAEARRQALERELRDLGGRLERLSQSQAQLTGEQEKLAADRARSDALADLAAGVERAKAGQGMAQAAVEAAEAARIAAQGAEADARETLRQQESKAATISAEVKALAGLLAAGPSSPWPPVLDLLTVDRGYETALGAALGDDLAIPIDAAAPAYWTALGPYDDAPSLPAEATPLSAFVAAPPALARRLAQIGVVEAAADPGLRAALRPGQVLVSRAGDVWRWDGFVAAADAPTAAAIRLAQRNRLKELGQVRTATEAVAAEARTRFDEKRAATAAAQTVEQDARRQLRAADGALVQAREAEARAGRETAAREARAEALAEALARVQRDLADIAEARERAGAQLGALPVRGQLDEARHHLAREVETLRAALAQARAARDGLRRESEARRRRLGDVANDLAAWRRRADSAERQIGQLAERLQGATEEQAELADRPAQLRTARDALADTIAAAEQARRAAADTLAGAEQALVLAHRQARAAEGEAGSRRETRVRCEAAVEQAQERRSELAARIADELDCTPAAILGQAELTPGEALPSLAELEPRLERLRRERDQIGPVNLRADQEAEAIESQLGTMNAEREDLVAAIGKLRASIGALNREGRVRLTTAFDQVNQHFIALFARLFGGGRAYLALTESDDPLDAGLEIYASPPGKKLQMLSLLSGGEQALTALALIFAVFLVNPSPICVLDEVDAPLDDSNVLRFCDLLHDVAGETGTRFLVVTHHAVTMQHMDRLFGVTMGEAGVSQLVSVDLGRAPELLAAE